MRKPPLKMDELLEKISKHHLTKDIKGQTDLHTLSLAYQHLDKLGCEMWLSDLIMDYIFDKVMNDDLVKDWKDEKES